MSGIRPVGDQILCQLLSVGRGHRPNRRRWHRCEVRIIGSLSSNQVSGVRRGLRVGVVPAGAGPVAERLNRVTGAKPEQHGQDRWPPRRPPCPHVATAAAEWGLPKTMFVFPTNWPRCRPHLFGIRSRAARSIGADVLDPDWRVTTFDVERRTEDPRPSAALRCPVRTGHRGGRNRSASLRKRQ